MLAEIDTRGWCQHEKEDGEGRVCYSVGVIAARHGELAMICSTGAIVRPWPSWGFVAVGSGAAYAYGAAMALRDHGHTSGPEMVRGALAAAVDMDTHCGPPLLVESTLSVGTLAISEECLC